MTTNPPTQTVSGPTYLFHPDNHLLDKKPTESDKDMEWTTNPPTEPRECNCIDCRVGRDLGLKPNYPTEPRSLFAELETAALNAVIAFIFSTPTDRVARFISILLMLNIITMLQRRGK